MGIEGPVLPQKRRAPFRFEVGEGTQYFEALDLVIACIKERFDQPYEIYSKLERLLLNTAKKNLHTASAVLMLTMMR